MMLCPWGISERSCRGATNMRPQNQFLHHEALVALEVRAWRQATNDKLQAEPMLGKLGALPEELGRTETLLADIGYFSVANVRARVAAQIDPLIAMGCQSHYPPAAAGQPDAGRGDGASPQDG